MPWKVEKDVSGCSASKPWAVKNSDTGRIAGCHETKDEAEAQRRALYVQVEDAAAQRALAAAAGPTVPVYPPVVLGSVPNVVLLEVGMDYPSMLGPVTFEFDHVAAAAGAQLDPTIPKPRLGIGHTDPRFNNDAIFDGTPAFGIVDNLRSSADGSKLVGDLVSVPLWLCHVMPVAWPSRSVEGWIDYEANSQRKYPFVLQSLKLLGVVWPGVMSMNDLELIPQMYGATQPDFVDVLDAA